MTDTTSLTLAPFRDRRTRFLQQLETSGWHLKLYAMTASGEDLASAVVTAAVAHAERHLPPASPTTPYGFILIHQGDQGVWLLLDLWADDILEQQIFKAPLASPTAFGPAPFTGTAACVWELLVIQHERDAWVRHILTDPSRADFGAYLTDRLEISTGTD